MKKHKTSHRKRTVIQCQFLFFNSQSVTWQFILGWLDSGNYTLILFIDYCRWKIKASHMNRAFNSIKLKEYRVIRHLIHFLSVHNAHSRSIKLKMLINETQKTNYFKAAYNSRLQTHSKKSPVWCWKVYSIYRSLPPFFCSSLTLQS